MDSIVHFEIPAANMARAKKFYSSIFGWKMKPFPAMDYTMVYTGETGKDGMMKKKGMINGGMIKRSGKVKAPVLYMYVNNIDAVLKKITKKGGKVVQAKMKVSGSMYTAYFKDCEGNVMGLVQGMM